LLVDTSPPVEGQFTSALPPESGMIRKGSFGRRLCGNAREFRLPRVGFRNHGG
jgi:hypothetical protein